MLDIDRHASCGGGLRFPGFVTCLLQRIGIELLESAERDVLIGNRFPALRG